MTRSRNPKRRARTRSPLLVIALAIVTSGCGDLFGPGIPDGAIRLLPIPPEYTAWWGLVERCSGLTGDLAAVEWGVVPGVESIPGSNGAAGTYYRNRHQIILIERGIHDGRLVRHEMLHALRRAAGHPHEAFVEKCGGLVSCAGPCRDEAQRTRPPLQDVAILDPRSLDLSVELFPDSISRGIGRGCVTIVVNATNPLPHSVGLRILPLGTVGWTVDGFNGGNDGGPLPIETPLVLQPGAMGSFAFDCPSMIDFLPPGTYNIGGRIGLGRSPTIPLRIAL